MISSTRKHVGGACAMAVALLLLVCSESRAQQGQWKLGVWTETISEDNALMGDPPDGMPRGQRYVREYMLRITNIVAGSAAEKAGLKKGDVIQSVNGKSVKTPEELARVVRSSSGVLNLSLKGRNGRRSKEIDLRDLVEVVAVGSFVPHIGIYYEKAPNADGTFGARLTQDAVQGSPATKIQLTGTTQFVYLEKGDRILALDGKPFRTEDDVRNHRFGTSIRFLDFRTGQIKDGSFTLP